MSLQFTQRVQQLADPYSPPQPSAKPRLDLRDVVPDFSALYDSNTIGPYPKTAPLAEALARKLGIESSQIAVTAGGDDALLQVIMAMIEPGKNLVAAAPTFPMIERYITLAGGEMRTVSWFDEEFPETDFANQIDAQTQILLFVSPNNPTGRTVSFSVIKNLAEQAPHAVIVLDAVYIEYANEDITAEFLNLPNSLVVRSFSKAYGAAGLRLGYALSKNPDLLTAMRKIAQPYAVSAPSIETGLQLLKNTGIETAIESIKFNRTELLAQLRELGQNPLPSEANFVFMPCPSTEAARDLFAQMGSRGISIRYFPGDPAIATYVRIGVPCRTEDLNFLLATLRELL